MDKVSSHGPISSEFKSFAVILVNMTEPYRTPTSISSCWTLNELSLSCLPRTIWRLIHSWQQRSSDVYSITPWYRCRCFDSSPLYCRFVRPFAVILADTSIHHQNSWLRLACRPSSCNRRQWQHHRRRRPPCQSKVNTLFFVVCVDIMYVRDKVTRWMEKSCCLFLVKNDFKKSLSPNSDLRISYLHKSMITK